MESAFGNQNKISLHAVAEPSDVFNAKMTQGLAGTFRVPDFPDNGSVDFAIGGPGLETQGSHVVHAWICDGTFQISARFVDGVLILELFFETSAKIMHTWNHVMDYTFFSISI